MDVASEILDAIEIIVDKKVRENTAQIYLGICKSVSGNTCVMLINGKDNTVQFYGSTPTVGSIYRVFVPNGNMSMAFVITGANDGSGGSSGVTSYTKLTDLPTINGVVLQEGATSKSLSLYGIGNEPNYPVTKVNGKTGEVTLTADDVGALSLDTDLQTDVEKLQTDVSNLQTEQENINTSLSNKANKDTVVNPNLLDNWYFANPVNQRGQTTYTTSSDEYTIDRWMKSAGTLNIEDGYISASLTNWGSIVQNIEPNLFKALAGKTLTFSVLHKNGQLKKVTFTPDSNYTSTDIWKGLGGEYGTMIYRWSNGHPNLTYANSQNSELVAVKLELGDNQTLAHQDADGNWVLNEIPNYGEQLARCQRYFVNFNPNKVNWFAMPPAIASNTTDAYSAVTLPVTMRAQPTVSYGGKIALSQTDDVQITGIQVSGNTFAGNYLQLKYSVADGLTANSTYRVQGYNDPTSYIWLSADL